jgi:hypothetical protein
MTQALGREEHSPLPPRGDRARTDRLGVARDRRAGSLQDGRGARASQPDNRARGIPFFRSHREGYHAGAMGRVHWDRARPGLASVVLAAAVVSSCVPSKPPQGPLRCTPPCAEVRQVTAPNLVDLALLAPNGSWLKNASLARTDAKGCDNGVPVAAVTVDGKEYSEGPVSMNGARLVTLRFPFTSDGDAPDAGLTPPVLLDVDLRVPGRDTCLRLPLPDPGTGLMAVTRTLSFRIAPLP